MTTTVVKPVLWYPSSFLDDQDAEFIDGDRSMILNMPLEDVVSRYGPQESRRKRDDVSMPEGRREERMHTRHAPKQLIDSIDLFARESRARSRATLMKCAVYPISAWFSQELKLDDLVSRAMEVDAAIRQIKDETLLDNLSKQYNTITFHTAEVENKNVYLITIGWLNRRLVQYGKALGADPSTLLAVGFGWFLTKTKHPELDPTNINKRYRKDANLLRLAVHERYLDLKLMLEKAEYRRDFNLLSPCHLRN